MTQWKRVYLDTNAFIFAIEEQSERADLLIELFSKSEDANVPIFVTSALTLAEVLVRPHRDGNRKLISRYDEMIRQSAWLDVKPISRPTLWYASVIRSRTRLKLPDALHLSTAIECECTHFLTDDRALGNVAGMYNARFATMETASITMAPLDIPTLTTLLESLPS